MTPSAEHTPAPTSGRRAATLVLFTLLGVFIGALGLLAILKPAGGLRSGSGTLGSTTTPRVDSGMSPADIILMHLPKSEQSSCTDSQPDRHDAIKGEFAYAYEVCKPHTDWTLEYASFHDAEAMRDRFQAELANVPGHVGSAAACRGNVSSGRGPFWMKETRANRGASPHLLAPGSLTKVTRGRVLCFTSATGERTIEWYDSDTHIYAWLVGSSDDAEPLFHWWVNSAGPYHPSMAAMREYMAGMSSPSMSPSMSSTMSPTMSPTM